MISQTKKFFNFLCEHCFTPAILVYYRTKQVGKQRPAPSEYGSSKETYLKEDTKDEVDLLYLRLRS